MVFLDENDKPVGQGESFGPGQGPERLARTFSGSTGAACSQGKDERRENSGTWTDPDHIRPWNFPDHYTVPGSSIASLSLRRPKKE